MVAGRGPKIAERNVAVRVVVDALSSRVGGGRTYVEELLAQDLVIPGLEVHAVVPDSLRLDRVGRGISLVTLDDRLTRPVARGVWEHVALPRLLDRLNADVLFCPGGTTPRRVALVVSPGTGRPSS